jgi:glycosyltransferase involved in cell wall biosynthesis
MQVAQDYGLQVRVNRGIAGIGHDWNFALSCLDGDYVVLAHQDDVYHPLYVERLLATIARWPDADLLFTSFELLDDPHWSTRLNRLVKLALLELGFVGRDSIASTSDKLRLLRFGNPITCPSVMLNRRKHPGFSFNTRLQSNLDWQAWLNLAMGDGSFVYLRDKLLGRRVHRGSTTSNLIRNSVRDQEDLLLFEQMWPRTLARFLAAIYRKGKAGSIG